MLLPPGARLGPYEILAALGAGGMGEVYRARDSRLGREVAIKILPARLASAPGFRERFAREARAISSVEHPHICPLYDVGTDGDVDYLVMQYIDGETLAQRIRRGSIPAPQAIALAQQLAAGLEAAHERGILHRDLKPSNIKLTPDGKVKILDFGLAKTLTEATPEDAATTSATAAMPLTKSGIIVGTAGYMSPEQTLGGTVDRRSDIWAFGCVLFEMLSGRPAFDAESVTQLLAAVVGKDPDWAALPATTPPRVRDLLRRCLRKDPTRRVRDIGDVRLELEDADSGEAEASAVERTVPARRGSAVVAWSIAGVLAVAAAGLLLTRLPARRGGGPAMRFSAVTNLSGVEAQPALSPDGRSVAFVSNRDGQWDIYVGLVGGGSLVRITNDPNVEMRPRWSPDGARLLYARLNETGLYDLWVAPALGGAARRLVLNATYPTWSPDGRSIAYGAGGVIWLCDASGEHPRAITSPEAPLSHVEPAFSHDARRLAFVVRSSGPYGELAILDLGTRSVKTITRDGALAWSPVWSPDDRFIYFASSRGGTTNVWKIPSASGEPEQITAGQGADSDIDLSADGKRLVFSTFRINLNLAEVSLEPASLGRKKWLTSDAARGELGPRYSPDGRRIAYFSNRGGAEREAIWVMDEDGANPTELVEDDYVNVFPRWTADGQQLVFVSREHTSLRGREFRRISVSGGAPEALSIKLFMDRGDLARDGRLIYQTSPDSGEVYDPRTRQRQSIGELAGDPLWSRDGRTFAYVVSPKAGKPSDAGLWIGTTNGARRQIFQGWVVSFAWAGAQSMLVMQGRPDFKGVLWRVDSEGRRSVVLSGVGLYRSELDLGVSSIRFDVHPDGRRIAIETLESLEADIGMIDNVR
jgi:Tol biopolymer transport system component